MGWEDLMNKLADAFTTDGIVGDGIGPILELEKTYGEFVEKTYKGHSILSHCFQEFYKDTIETAATVWKEKDRKPTPPTYSETLLWHLGNFRCVRAVDVLFHNGYPMDGFARLRHLKESALYLGAMFSGLTTFSRINGLDGVVSGKPLTREDMNVIRQKRKQEEKRLLGLMIRATSGLPPEHIELLERWESYFHEEVHGAHLTQVFEHGPAITGEDTTSVAPKPREKSCAMFINRFCEIAWMLHRTLPIMQLTYRPFGAHWNHKWHLLDENFRVMEGSLAEMGKKIGEVFIAFVDTKFPFTPVCFFDAMVKT